MASSNTTVRAVKARLRRRRLRHGLILLPVILFSIAVLIAALCIPVLQIFGSSMSPALNNNETVAVLRRQSYGCGDIIAFECQGQILTRRVIAGPGSIVDIDEYGNVTVDGVVLDEPYVTEKSRGVCTVTFPLQIPDGHYFVLGDRRITCVDSRSTIVGCVPLESIIGKVFLVLLPGENFRTVQ